MRRFALVLAVVALLAAQPAHAGCHPESQDGVVCDTHCITNGQLAGYCNVNVPTEPERGCVQLFEGCASMDNVPCCMSEGLF